MGTFRGGYRKSWFAVVAALVVIVAGGQTLQAADIHPVSGSTTDPITWGSIANTIDGVPNYDSYLALGPLAIGDFTGPFTITYDLGGVFDLTGMHLWNNAGQTELDGEGIDGFTLSFMDSSLSPLGNFSGHATDRLAMQGFLFTASDVAFVDLTITSNHDPTVRQYVAFHEISFTPEPASLSLVALGLGALVARKRRKA